MNSTSDERLPVSVLIPAKNEELNLDACLRSVVDWADEVFVVDSQSSDRTVEIAESYERVQVVEFDFNGRWPKKKNWSLRNLPFSHEWVLIVDCDERIPDELWQEIRAAIQDEKYDGYYLNRKVYFFDRWIKHGGKYPDWNMRLFKHKKGRYENLYTEDVPNTGDNEVHEHVILKGKEGFLKTDIIHNDFRDLYQWIARHNRYSNWEAQVYENFLKGRYDEPSEDYIHPNLFGNGLERKRFLKKFWVRLPLKPLLRFVLFYFFRFGFLDGKAGFLYATLLSNYENQIGAKLYQLGNFGWRLSPVQNTRENLTPESVPEPESVSSSN